LWGGKGPTRVRMSPADSVLEASNYGA